MLLVSDANIFIDFEVAGLIVELFRLPHEILVPDVLYEQELADRHEHLIGHGLKTMSLNSEQVAAVFDLRRQHMATGVNDLFALVLAKTLGCSLVTGDRRLRAIAQTEGVQLMGTLTLMEQLFYQGILDIRGVEDEYRKMQDAGRRLPTKEISAQLQRMKAGP